MRSGSAHRGVGVVEGLSRKPRQKPGGRRCVPRTTAQRENAPGVQFIGNCADADDTLRTHVIHDGAEVSRTALSVGLSPGQSSSGR
jgi:hypothetical protein